jgi:hypothetical protein
MLHPDRYLNNDERVIAMLVTSVVVTAHSILKCSVPGGCG